LDVLSSELGKFLKVRRFDGATKPLLAPEEAVYLELNLRLMLERSQLAALRRQQLVYEQSLGSAQEWLHEYLDAEAPVVQELVAEIEALLEVQLDQALPDVSGSLSALLAVLRGDS
jgi:uroporphyrin-3 C-methyltransferase